MREIPDAFPSEAPSPGTHLLGRSPPFVGLQHVTMQYVASGLETGDGCVLVSTNKTAGRVVDTLGDRTTAANFDQLGIVDATRQDPADVTAPCRLESVTSPADLTGIGIAINKLLESLYASDVDGYRVVIDSVSPLLVYADFERVYKFLHAVTNQVDVVDGTSIMLISDDTEQAELHKLESLFDGNIEVRDADDDPEYRVSWHSGTTDWRPLPIESRATGGDISSTSSAGTDRSRASATDDSVPALWTADSLHEMITTMEAEQLTLTLCNYTGGAEQKAELREYFTRFNVAVRTATLSTETPTNAALLHQGSDVYATSSVSDIVAALNFEGLDTGTDLTSVVQPDVLRYVHRNEYTIEDGSKLELVRICRLIETRALDAGTGTIHAGFQRVDRLDDEFHTRELYEAIAEAGVRVHLYGAPGDLPNEELYTLHTGETDELTTAWFVVYDGGGRDALKAAEVCEETSPDRYSGFWTYRPGIVDAVESYLRTTYGAS